MTNTDREPVAWGVIWPDAPDPSPGFHDATVSRNAADQFVEDGATIVPLSAAPPPTAPTEIAVNRCQLCGGEIQGWMCQSCPATFSENEDGWLVLDPRPALTPSDGEPFMWGAEWEGGCGRMFREAYRTEEDARREAEHLNGRAFPLFRRAGLAPTVEEVARVIVDFSDLADIVHADPAYAVIAADRLAARIIELFQGKA